MKQTITTVYPDGTQEVREMTDEEIAAQEADRQEFAKMEAELKAKDEERAAVKAAALSKLEALGLTTEEAQAIAGI